MRKILIIALISIDFVTSQEMRDSIEVLMPYTQNLELFKDMSETSIKKILWEVRQEVPARYNELIDRVHKHQCGEIEEKDVQIALDSVAYWMLDFQQFKKKAMCVLIIIFLSVASASAYGVKCFYDYLYH